MKIHQHQRIHSEEVASWHFLWGCWKIGMGGVSGVVFVVVFAVVVVVVVVVQVVCLFVCLIVCLFD